MALQNRDVINLLNEIVTYMPQARERLNTLAAGDIGAVNKLSNTNTGDTLCDPSAKIRFTPIFFPKPTLFMSVAAEKKGEEDKVFAGLAKLKEEDYTFSIEKNAETSEMVIGGQGVVAFTLNGIFYMFNKLLIPLKLVHGMPILCFMTQH